MKQIANRIALALLALGVAAAQAQPNTPAPKPLPKREIVRVAQGPGLEAFAPLYIANGMGEFAKENIEVQFVNLAGSNAILLLQRGEVDAINNAPSAGMMNAIAQGAEIRMVAPGMFNNDGTQQGVWVSSAFLAGRPYTPTLLKGQTIASSIGSGSSTVYYIALELEKAGLTMRDVSFKILPAPDIVTALEAGAVGFGIVNAPMTNQISRDKARFAFGITAGYSLGGLFFGPTLVKERREVGEAFIRAWVRGVRTHLQGNYRDNPKVMEILVREIKATEAAIRQGPLLVFPPDQPISAAMLSKLQDIYAATPDTLSYKDKLPDERIADRKFLEAATR